MGSCCFTPRKYNFLWWYWLVLASIIGIPMLLAAWYMQHQKLKIEGAAEKEDSPAPRELLNEQYLKAGKTARRIFWDTVIFFSILGLFVSYRLAERTYSELAALRTFQTQYLLVCEFFLCIIITNFAVASWRKSKTRFGQGLIIAIALAFWIAANPFGRLLYVYEIFGLFDPFGIDADVIRPFVSTLTFACGWYAMYYWREFLDQPTRRNIWRSIGAVLLAALLYYGAERYGNLAHYQIHELARFRLPDPIAAQDFKTAGPDFTRRAP